MVLLKILQSLLHVVFRVYAINLADVAFFLLFFFIIFSAVNCNCSRR